MPPNDFIFVDESGDPGYVFDETSGKLLSSPYYVAAALHVCDDSIAYITEHIAAFRYLSRMNRELKIPPGKDDYRRLMEPVQQLALNGSNVWGSAVYLEKTNYNGRYLKAGGSRQQSPVRFRNYILRCLLEHHFSMTSLKSNQYDLVLDRIEITREETDNLQSYIAGNYNIPTPTNITHASSIYVDGLQVVHHIANSFKDVVSGGDIPEEVAFVNARDITTDQYILP